MKILVTDDMHPVLDEVLEPLGLELDHKPNISRKEILSILKDYQGLIVRTRIDVDREMIDSCPDLQLIGRSGSGMENIDVDHALTKGITCINSPEGNRNAVGEHTLGLLLSLINNITSSDRQIRNGLWNREANRGEELDNMTVGIIGFGNTGSSFARKLGGFDCRIMAYDKFKTGFGSERVEEVQLNDIQNDVDVVSLHLPLDDSTRNLINEAFINEMSKPFYLINTSRGGIVRTKDLLVGLNAGKILGAGLDVLENENLDELSESEKEEFNDLKAIENTVLTPHVAGWSIESKKGMPGVLAEKIKTWFLAQKS